MHLLQTQSRLSLAFDKSSFATESEDVHGDSIIFSHLLNRSLTSLQEANIILPEYFGFFGFFRSFRIKITRRQETFIYKLLDLYRELDGPIHYSVLAERVGVSPFTAYDMLRLLEEKGLVASEYHVATDKPTPGRSEGSAAANCASASWRRRCWLACPPAGRPSCVTASR